MSLNEKEKAFLSVVLTDRIYDNWAFCIDMPNKKAFDMFCMEYILIQNIAMCTDLELYLD